MHHMTRLYGSKSRRLGFLHLIRPQKKSPNIYHLRKLAIMSPTRRFNDLWTGSLDDIVYRSAGYHMNVVISHQAYVYLT